MDNLDINMTYLFCRISVILVKPLLSHNIEKWIKKMKKIIIISLLVALILMLTVTMTFAAGGKERGDKAQGPAWQYQINCPAPFEYLSTGVVLYQTSWTGNMILYSK